MTTFNAGTTVLPPAASARFPVGHRGTTQQTGAELGTSENTIKAQRGRVMLKMEAESVAELVRMADQLRVRPV
ncbi:MAG TPA: LuxR C-terminal-related transcriptional regulator [Candidatus Binataceae bacterium]|nr:LuxR C-terminal-related transcriptional regulator [Candidatus Binataceae bacterium]